MKKIIEVQQLQNMVSKIEDINLTEKESEVILGYFEGHDYMIAIKDNDTFVVDVQDEKDIVSESFKMMLHRVLDWNEELLTDVSERYEDLEEGDYTEYQQLDMKCFDLKRDAKIVQEVLDKVYENSIQGLFDKLSEK